MAKKCHRLAQINVEIDEYDPHPAVRSLKDFLALVDEDKHHCFHV